MSLTWLQRFARISTYHGEVLFNDESFRFTRRDVFNLRPFYTPVHLILASPQKLGRLVFLREERLHSDIATLGWSQLMYQINIAVPHSLHRTCNAMKDCSNRMHSTIYSVSSIINAMPSSVKRRDLYEKISIELDVSFSGLLDIDVETQWSSTFAVIDKEYKSRVVFNALVSQIPELTDVSITEQEWERPKQVCDF